MENGAGNIGASDAATLALLYGGGRGGGIGVGGGGYYGSGHGSFASPGSNAVRMDRNAQQVEDQADCTRTVLGGAIDSMSGSFENLTRQNQFNELRDGQFRSELRSGDRLRDIEDKMAENAAAAAKCCCDLKLQMCEDKSELKADILAVESRNVNRALDAANAKITQLETINALGSNGHGGGH